MKKINLIKIYKALMVIFVSLCLTGCDLREEKSNIAAVWKHGVGNYSVTIKKGNELIDKSLFSPDTKVIMDVPENSNMWYEATYDSFNCLLSVIIHIYSIEDINGAEWKINKNRGKITAIELEREENKK